MDWYPKGPEGYRGDRVVDRTAGVDVGACNSSVASPPNKKVAASARGARFREHGAGAPRRQLLNVNRQPTRQPSQEAGTLEFGFLYLRFVLHASRATYEAEGKVWAEGEGEGEGPSPPRTGYRVRSMNPAMVSRHCWSRLLSTYIMWPARKSARWMLSRSSGGSPMWSMVQTAAKYGVARS